MLSLLLIATLAVQYPSSSQSSQDTTAKRTTAAPRGNQAAVSRMAFHDRMRELWSDHIVYTRSFIVSASAGLADTAAVLQRLLQNQDEIGDAIKPYYGEANGAKLAGLLRGHIQHAGKALVAAKGSAPTQVGMNVNMRDTADTFISNRMSRDTIVSSRVDTTKINSQNPNPRARMTDTTKAKRPNARVTGDTISERLPSNQYGNVRPDTASAQSNVNTQGQMQVQVGQQSGQADSVQLNQAVAALKANADSIATFLSQANPRGFSRETLRNGLNTHIDLLLKEVTAHLKKDWDGSIKAADESLRQAMQMADMLSEGIMKQFPSRFTNRTTAVSTR